MPRLINLRICRERVSAQTYLRGLYNIFLARECAEDYVDDLVYGVQYRIYGSMYRVVRGYLQYLCYRRRLTVQNIVGGDRIVLQPFYCLSFRQVYELVREYLHLRRGISLRLSRDDIGTLVVPCTPVDCTDYFNRFGWAVYYYAYGYPRRSA